MLSFCADRLHCFAGCVLRLVRQGHRPSVRKIAVRQLSERAQCLVPSKSLHLLQFRDGYDRRHGLSFSLDYELIITERYTVEHFAELLSQVQGRKCCSHQVLGLDYYNYTSPHKYTVLCGIEQSPMARPDQRRGTAILSLLLFLGFPRASGVINWRHTPDGIVYTRPHALRAHRRVDGRPSERLLDGS